ncbi:MAG: hypothetical protein ACRD5B_01750, partial [Nitrososphaeraceae archaeon]
FRHQTTRQDPKDLEFVSIHSNAEQVARRLCNKCGKWISVIELGFSKYKLVEIRYFIENELIASPYITVVLKYTDHICTNYKDDFCISKFQTEGVHRADSNNNELLSDSQSTKTTFMEIK